MLCVHVCVPAYVSSLHMFVVPVPNFKSHAEQVIVAADIVEKTVW